MALSVGANTPQFVTTVTLDPANVPASSVSTQSFTVTGVRTDVMYKVDALSLEAGLFIVSATPTANNTLLIGFFNPSVADINPSSQVFRIIGF